MNMTMIRQKATLRDVAKAVGVHLSTVSRVMNPQTRHLMTDDIADRVLKAAKELGYTTNLIAASLRTNRSQSIGVVVPDITNPLFPPILMGIEDALTEADYTPIIANTRNDPDRYRTVVNRLIGRQVDGLIFATVTRRDPVIEESLKTGIPIVVVNRRDDDARVSSVINDDPRGIELAVGHVLALGHRRIAHVAGPQNLSTGQARHFAFRNALLSGGIEPDPRMIVFADSFTIEAGYEACRTLLEGNPAVTAIVAANDLLALGCYDALKRNGLRCPEDVSVTGFNDMPLVDRVMPPLTTIRIRHHEIGEQAARLLLNQINNGHSDCVDIVLKPELVIRKSVIPSIS